MADIDLIPQEFKQSVSRLWDLKVVVVLTVVIILGSVATGLLLKTFADRANENRNQLARQLAVSEQQGNELTQLSTQRDQLLDQRDTLTRLRGGAMVTELIQAIDRALPNDDVWFLDWSFRRAGTDSDADDVQTNGYFIVVDENQTDNVQTHMNITGQALDHAALSRFVRQLFNQPEVFDVRVRQTTVRRYPTHSIVDFQLSIVLQSKVS